MKYTIIELNNAYINHFKLEKRNYNLDSMRNINFSINHIN